MILIIKYTVFCVLAIILNLLTQRACLNLIEIKASYFIALISGTVVGLLVKYYLDKNFIFIDNDNSLYNNSRKFSLYSLNGIITTSIFWGTETMFFYVYATSFARELGAIIGLSIGYFLKYKLDKKFVFQKIR